MSISVQMLKAGHGDCLLITHATNDTTFRLLIDGGTAATFSFGPRGKYPGQLKQVLNSLKAESNKIDLVVLTHVDDDHIGGLIRAFSTDGYLKEMARKVWFNSSEIISRKFESPLIEENKVHLDSSGSHTSIKQGLTLEGLLKDADCHEQEIILAGQTYIEGPLKISILSPELEDLKFLLGRWPKELLSPETSNKRDWHLSLNELLHDDRYERDGSETNLSSISFKIEAEGKCLLFLGDSHAETIINRLRREGFSKENKLKLSLVKIAHHASEKNTSAELLSLLDADCFLISTDGTRHGHPHKKTIARILESSRNCVIYFNHETIAKNILLADESSFAPRIKYLQEGITL